MAITWVTHPGNQFPKDPELKKSVENNQKIFAAIDEGSYVECCRVCGSVEDLSLEHTPSKAAFNKKSFISLSVSHPLKKFLQWKARKIQGGKKAKSLCITCNNNSGAWYNSDYVKLTEYCAAFAKPENANSIVNVKESLYPARIIKQALFNICSVSQPGLCKEYNHLKDFLMERSRTTNLKPIKLGLFISVARTGRSSGITIFVDTERKISRVMAEFSFWPIGWIFTLDGLPYDGTLDVTSWAAYQIDEKINLSLEIPCRWSVSPYPGDFRSPGQVFKKA